MDQFGSRYGSPGSGTRVIPSGPTGRPTAHTNEITRPAPSQTPLTETYNIGRYLDQTGKQAGSRTSNPGGITGRALTLYCQGFLNGHPHALEPGRFHVTVDAHVHARRDPQRGGTSRRAATP